jgi:hypothetical protein
LPEPRESGLYRLVWRRSVSRTKKANKYLRVAFRLINDKQIRRPLVDYLRTLRFDEALSDRVEGARHAVVNGGGCL